MVENFGVTPDAWQAEALTHFGNQDEARMRLSLQACAGPGKSALLSWCGWNFICCYGEAGDHPKGAAISITRDNLKDNLWAEFARWMHQPPAEWIRHAFRWTHERISSADHPETWFISARSWPKTASPEEQGATLSGLHSGYVLLLIDESGDIPTTVLKAGEQAFSSAKFARMMQAGNPLSRDGMLYAAATTLRDTWHVIRVTGDPDDPRRSTRIDIEWARQQIKIHGRDDPWIKVYLLGQFPDQAINSLLSIEEVQAAMDRELREDQYSFAQKRLGIDAARFGDDSWVIFPRQGLAAFTPVEMRMVRSQVVSARVQMAKLKWGSEREFFDDTGGYAAGAIDDLVAAGYSPTPINFSQSALDPRFYNARAEMHWNKAQWVKRGGCLPYIPRLVKEMTALTYTFKNGKLIVENKELVKKKLNGQSPDFDDALGLTFAEPDMPADLVANLRGSNQARTEFDPYASGPRTPIEVTAYDRGLRMRVEEQEHTRGHAETEFDPFGR